MSDKWKQALADHTGQWAFVLNLSRRMVQGIECIRDGESLSLQTGHFIPILKALERRGLVEHWYEEVDQPWGGRLSKGGWRLTPAGRSVCDLLVMAGQISKPRVRITGAAA